MFIAVAALVKERIRGHRVLFVLGIVRVLFLVDLGNGSVPVIVLVLGLGVLGVIVLVADGHAVPAEQIAEETTATELKIPVGVVGLSTRGIGEVVEETLVSRGVTVMVDSKSLLAAGVVDLVGDRVFVSDQGAAIQRSVGGGGEGDGLDMATEATRRREMNWIFIVGDKLSVVEEEKVY